MLFLLINWVYVFINVFVLAAGIKLVIGKLVKNDIRDYDIWMLSAVAMLTVYAETVSLFMKVGAAANIVLILINILIAYLSKDEIKNCIYSFLKKKHCKWIIVFFICFTIFIAANSSGPNIHVDTELYHGQAVRWIEEYGVVKGLGNVLRRSAYNSGFLCLQALFSFKFVFGQSLRSMNGFCTLLLFGIALSTLKIWNKKCLFASDVLKLSILLMYAITDSFTSVNTDLFAMGVAVYIFAKWLSCMEDDDKEPIRYSLLSLLAVYAATLKLSAAFIVFLAIMPACMLIRKKRWREIVVYMLGGALS